VKGRGWRMKGDKYGKIAETHVMIIVCLIMSVGMQQYKIEAE
jgi:hypothetical protein